jgi:NADH:ubiquinone reductase (H+-translocating)
MSVATSSAALRATSGSTSRFGAIAEMGRLRVSGFVAWLLWLAVHLLFLTGFKNRVAVLFNWTIAFVGRGRPQRAGSAQQVFARQALAAGATVIRTPISSQTRLGAGGPGRSPWESN